MRMIPRILQRHCFVSFRLLNRNALLSSTTCSERKWKISSFETFAQPSRCFTLESGNWQREVSLPGRIFNSHLPDIDIPNIPFHEMMFQACDQHKEKPALTDFLTGKTYTYNQVKENCIRVASALSKKGYKKGDVILMFSTNHIDYFVLMVAAASLGVWFSAANPGFTADELARQINHSQCMALFTTEALAATAEKALQSEGLTDCARFVFGEYQGWQPFHTLLNDDGKAYPDVPINAKEDVFVLPYSSGTTGLPKGVMLTHYNIVANVMQSDCTLPVSPGENLIGLLPLYHIYGMVFIQFGALNKGAHLHVLPKFEPETFVKCLKDGKITRAHLVPPIVLFMAKHPAVMKHHVDQLKYVICAAAPLGKEITDEFLTKFDHGCTLKQAYGLTETSPVTNLDPGNNFGSIGHLVCNTIGKVVDTETGEMLGPFEEGEYCVRGPQVMKGYYKNPEATKEMVKEDGWLHTGDIGYYNEEGIMYISDRLKELIKYKGSQIAPAELEALLIGHPDLVDACVIGLPDERAGELPKAFVVRKPNSQISGEDVMKYVEERVSQTKRLRGGVEFIDQIPKNPSGKILRRLLKTR